MALKTIMEETTFEASIYSEDLGCYCFFIDPMPFGFDIGSTYRVEWGDDTYECTGQDGSSIISGSTFIGNASVWGLSGKEEPFLIGGPFDGALAFLCLTDTAPSTHTVAIYEVVETTGIIIKDRDGNDVTHEGVSRIRTRAEDGGMKEFVDSDSIPEGVETTVELDFSSGDMDILPSEGEVFSKVSIPKPVNLIPGNIVNGVEIAGIVGELTGGASGLERVTRVSEQTITPAFDSYYGCYKTVLSTGGTFTGKEILAVRFNGVWYVCSPHKVSFTAGSLNQTITMYANHTIMKKYFNNSLTWKDPTEQPEPFGFTTNKWVMTPSAGSFTIRIDELTVTE